MSAILDHSEWQEEHAAPPPLLPPPILKGLAISQLLLHALFIMRSLWEDRPILQIVAIVVVFIFFFHTVFTGAFALVFFCALILLRVGLSFIQQKGAVQKIVRIEQRLDVPTIQVLFQSLLTIGIIIYLVQPYFSEL